MAQYLDKFAGTIGKRQAQQILNLLNKQRNTGQIRSVKEFTTKLEDLMRELTSTELQPSLRMWAGEQAEDIDSESYNFMLDRVQDDLEAAFEEAGNIDEVQRSHEAIIRDVILKNLRAGVAELESKVDLFEFLNKDTRGFDSAIFSTFRESKEERTQRQGSVAQVLFRDPRELSELVPTSQDATVELVGERLVLAVNDNSQHTISDVRQVFDSESPQSELLVEPPGSNLRNMIDNTRGTYWVQSLLFSEKKHFVKVKLEFKLGSIKEINYIEIEPASKFGFILEAVHYVDGNNVVTDLEVPEREIGSDAAIKFKKVATDRVILTFRNENARYTEFEHNQNAQPLFSQALDEPPLGVQPTPESISKELDEAIGSEKIKAVVGVQSVSKDRFGGWEFVTGVDNVRIGIAEHEERSIYASAPLSVEGIGEVGVKAMEVRPYIEQSSGATKFTDVTYDLHQQSVVEDDSTLAVGEQSKTWFQGSIEYWILKLDLTDTGALARTSTFPVLPLDVERVYHERLVLNDKSDTSLTENDLGWTMFFTNRTDGDVKVYRNGILLEDTTPGVGDPDPTDGWVDVTTTADKTPNNGAPMRFRIKIVDRLPGDIFTVSYTPVLSSTHHIPKTLSQFDQIGGLNVVDLVGDLSARANPGQIVGLSDQVEGTTANAYLVIILRQNTAEPTLTPAVEEYTLVAGRKDPTKFEEL